MESAHRGSPPSSESQHSPSWAPSRTRHCARGHKGEQDRQTDRRKPELRCQWGNSSLRVQVGERGAEGHARTRQHLNISFMVVLGLHCCSRASST